MQVLGGPRQYRGGLAVQHGVQSGAGVWVNLDGGQLGSTGSWSGRCGSHGLPQWLHAATREPNISSELQLHS